MLSNYPLEHYSPKRIQESILILHPKVLERYKITLSEFHSTFERGSNFSQLKYPIVDEHWFKYYDSEWYYMAQRFYDINIKKAISEASQIKWESKKVAYEHYEDMNQNPEDRIEFMRKAIWEKHDRSTWRKWLLRDTWSREIIEFTYWWDDFFWICDNTRMGRNILGKLLMEYRNELVWNI